jgi:hypothetical protein
VAGEARGNGGGRVVSGRVSFWRMRADLRLVRTAAEKPAVERSARVEVGDGDGVVEGLCRRVAGVRRRLEVLLKR